MYLFKSEITCALIRTICTQDVVNLFAFDLYLGMCNNLHCIIIILINAHLLEICFDISLGRPMSIQLMDGPNAMKSPANPNKGNVRQRVGQQRGL